MINPLGKSLANRIMLMVAFIVSVLTILFIAYFTLHTRNALNRYGETAGLSFAESLAQSSVLGVMASEPHFLEHTFEIALNNTEVVFVAAYDAKGMPIRKISKVPINLNLSPDLFKAIEGTKTPIETPSIRLSNDTVDDYFAPVRTEIPTEELSDEILSDRDEIAGAMETIGYVRIGFSRARIVAAQRTSTVAGLAIGVSVLAFGIIITYLLGRRITGPLKDLENVTRKVTEGDFNVSLEVKTEDEVGSVAMAFNAMAKALRQTTVSKDFMDNIVGSMNDALVVVGAERRIETMNTAAEKLLGYESSELVGISVDAIFSEAEDHPFDQKRWQHMISKAASNLMGEYRTKGGGKVPVSISSAPMHDRQDRLSGVVLIARDMREINSLLEQLRSHTDELERYQSVLLSMLDDNEKARAETESERLKTLAAVNSMSEGLIMHSSIEDRIALINPSAKSMLDLDPETDVTTEDIRGALGATFDTFIRKGETIEERRLLHDIVLGTDIPRTIRVEGLPVGQFGQWIGSMLVLRDITRERQLDEAKYGLISNVSHELRTPLAIINNVLSNLLVGISGPLPDKVKVNIETCKSNTGRLSRIIDGLLDVSSLDAGKVTVHKVLTKLNSFVNKVVSEHKSSASDKDISLDVDLPHDEVYSYCDPKIISEVLANLISNAIRYTPNGGHVTISARRSESDIEISVSDTGIGIRPDEQASIFEHFYQIGRTYGPGEKGVGLGLAISRLLIERHDGSIGVTSSPGKGSKFYFVFPDPKGEELIAAYLSDKFMHPIKGGVDPRLIAIRFMTDDTENRVSKEECIRIAGDAIEGTLSNIDHAITAIAEEGEILIIFMPQSEDISETTIGKIRTISMEIEKNHMGLHTALGHVSCVSIEKDARQYIAEARKLAMEMK